MLSRLLSAVLLMVALIVGYLLGNGPASDWVVDVLNMLSIQWNQARLGRSGNGVAPLLVAGFLFGQGIYLSLRQLITRFASVRRKRSDHLATWDRGVQLGSRFGLHQYLKKCSIWATEDPTARIPSIAFFKLRGLNELNDRLGPSVGTLVLRRIAAELRAASSTGTASALERWFLHHTPGSATDLTTAIPPVRFPARWSGATFALAFRDLEALQTVSIVRAISDWIRLEISTIDETVRPTLSVAVSIGSPGVTAKGLIAPVRQTLASTSDSTLTVMLDPTDVRALSIAQLGGIDVKHTPMAISQEDAKGSDESDSDFSLTRSLSWGRTWGLPFACLAGAILLLNLTGHASQIQTSFPWPENLTELQIVDPSGPKTIRLTRTHLPDQATSEWALSDVLLIQGNIKDGSYALCQIHVAVRNNSKHSYFVSPYDFTAIDKSGSKLVFDPQRALRIANGLTGKWLAPGESISGWLPIIRRDAEIAGLVFWPDRDNHIVIGPSSEASR